MIDLGLVICHFVLLMFVLVCVVLISEVLRCVHGVPLFELVFRVSLSKDGFSALLLCLVCLVGY